MLINDFHTFKLGFFPKPYFFETQNHGIVIEKESDVVSVYATSKSHSPIYCSIPLCHPKELKSKPIRIINKNNLIFIELDTYRIAIDFENHICANNKNLMMYGSESWGEDIQRAWNELLDKAF